MQVKVKPDLLRWAFDRAGLDEAAAVEKFPRLGDWLTGKKEPTLKQLESFAKRTHAAIGYFFLDNPPIENLPIDDLRTLRNEKPRRPSADLLDTIYLCQRRQEWYRDWALANEQEPLAFVGSATTQSNVEATAATMRRTLRLDLEERAALRTWEEARRKFISHAEEIGVMVLTSGIVGLNTSRALDTAEFRGFALADNIAPLVFINGRDSYSAQMFTLAHELAHVWLGQSAVTDQSPLSESGPPGDVETWCNQVAAELLVPRDVFLKVARRGGSPKAEARRLASVFKVSTLVLLRRMFEFELITRDEFFAAYESELADIADKKARERERDSGGNFHTNLRAAVGGRFAHAIVADTLAGNTLPHEAMRLLGMSNEKAFDGFAQSLGLTR